MPKHWNILKLLWILQDQMQIRLRSLKISTGWFHQILSNNILTPLLPDHPQMHDRLCSLCHILCSDPFQFAVYVLHAGKNIGAWHADITETAAISSATDA